MGRTGPGGTFANGMVMTKKIVFSSLLLLAQVCCIGPSSVPTARLVSGKPEPFVQTNYTKGVPRTALAGEAIVTHEEYQARRQFPNYFILNRQIVIRTRKHTFAIPHGHVLTFLDTIEINGENLAIYLDAHDNDGSGEMYYVKPDMRLANFMYVRSHMGDEKGMEKIQAVSPSGFTFKGRFEVDPASKQMVKAYDLIFVGQDDQGIHATYREHDLTDPTRVTSTRDLTLPADADPFRYGTLALQIHRCSGRALDYTVIAD